MPIVLQYKVSDRPHTFPQRLKGPLFDDILIVVPTKRRIRHLTREVIRAESGGALGPLPFHTLESLARVVYTAMANPRPIVVGPMQTLLYHNAVKARGSSLRYFRVRRGDVPLYRGTFEKIVDVITHLKESGVYPDLLEEETGAAPLDEREKLRDVTSIYTAYEEALEAIHGVDAAGVYKHLSVGCSESEFEAAFRSLYPNVNALSMEGFDEFTLPEIGFVRKLCAVRGVSVSLVFDFLPGNNGLFGHLRENYNRFRELGFVDIGPEESSRRLILGETRVALKAKSVVDHIARTLFNPDFRGSALDCSSSITLMRGRNRSQEVELICKLIKRYVADHPGQDLSTICVATARPQEYTSIMREQFSSFGIPANITDRFTLSRSPLVVGLLGILQIPLNGFRRDDLLRVLRTPYFTFADHGSAVDSANLAEVSRRLRITAGEHAWLGTIDRHVNRLALERQGTSEGSELARIERELRSFRRARHDFALISEMLQEIRGEGTAHEFRRHLSRLVERLEVGTSLINAGPGIPGEVREKDVRAYAKLIEVIDDFVALLDFQDGKQKTHPLKFYVEQLKIALARERYNVREQFGRGVLVTSIEETRGLPMGLMILAGLVDGEFPSVYQPEVFLAARRRKEREQYHTWRHRYLFYQAVTNWSTHLYLTYPAKEGDLDLVRSSFVESLLKVAQVTEWNDEFEVPFGRTLCSEQEFLQYSAGHLEEARRMATTLPGELAVHVEEVGRAIAIERSRLEDHSLPQFEGRILAHLPPQYRETLRTLRDRTYSVSQLETYGQCPFKFFAERLLRLNGTEDLREDLTPVEKGALLHEALFEFYTDRRAKGLPSIIDCTDQEFDAAVEALVGITREKLSTIEIPDAFWDFEKELILGGSGIEGGLLRRFLAFERNRAERPEPKYFEVGFGGAVGPKGETDSILSRDEPIELAGIKVRGKVDRVEVGNGFFSIIDYKTGRRVPGRKEIESGWSLQLPLYLYAMEELLKARGFMSLEPAGGLYYQLTDPPALRLGLGSAAFNKQAFTARSNSPQLVSTQADLRERISASVNFVEKFVGGMTAGEFPLTGPENVERVCVYCAQKTMCRIQTIRHVEPKTPEDV